MRRRSTSTHLVNFIQMRLRMCLLSCTSIAMLCCALAKYIELLKITNHIEQRREHSGSSVLKSSWFFYMNASVCFVSLICLIMLM